MRDLVESYEPEELMQGAFGLYEEFCPEIPPGTTG
jgi:hypothetical protein